MDQRSWGCRLRSAETGDAPEQFGARVLGDSGVTLPAPGGTSHTGLAPGVAYTYRVRHRRGSDASAWSNTDGVGTTWPEPYGPLGP